MVFSVDKLMSCSPQRFTAISFHFLLFITSKKQEMPVFDEINTVFVRVISVKILYNLIYVKVYNNSKLCSFYGVQYGITPEYNIIKAVFCKTTLCH